MLSSVKNFFLTFVLALVIFGLIAAAVLSIAISNINGKLAAEETGTPVSSSGTLTPGDVIPEYVGKGSETSLNILVIGSTYREGVYADYNREQLERLYGIRSQSVLYEAAPQDAGVPSAKAARSIFSDREAPAAGGIRLNDDVLVFEGGFFTVPTRCVTVGTLALIRFDRERSSISYSVFPTDVYLSVNGTDCLLSEVYGKYGPATVCDAVHSLTGVPVDRYVEITADGFVGAVNALGGLDCTVPCDMQYDDDFSDIHIRLSAGQQKLDGAAALQLLQFDSYKNGQGSRGETAVLFFRALVARYASSTGRARVANVYDALKPFFVNTDLTADDLADNLSLAVRASATQITVSAVTEERSIKGNEHALFFDKAATLSAFSSYKRIFNVK